MANLDKYERETIINFNEAEPTASVYTFNRSLQSKLNKLLSSNPDISLKYSDEERAEYIVPKKWIKVSPPRQVNLTDEQRAAAAERLSASRAKKLNNYNKNLT